MNSSCCPIINHITNTYDGILHDIEEDIEDNDDVIIDNGIYLYGTKTLKRKKSKLTDIHKQKFIKCIMKHV